MSISLVLYQSLVVKLFHTSLILTNRDWDSAFKY